MAIVDRRLSVSGDTAVKQPCVCATTANITLSGEQTIDGVAAVTDDRVLVKDQDTGSENGIYNVSTGNWTRARDFDGAYDVVEGTRVLVVRGTANALLEYYVSTTGAITVGTTSVTFTSRTVNGMDGPGASVDGEAAVFNGTPGTALKRFTGSGIVKAVSGVLSVITKIPIANGGTNATTASGARSNLGLVIGTNVQAQNAQLADIAGASLSQGDVLYYDGSNIVNLGAGTSGQRLTTKGSGANPVWAGGHAYAEYTAFGSLTTVLPHDDTIPQISEGTEILSAAFAASSSSSTLRITVSLTALSSITADASVGVAIFNGATDAINAFSVHRIGNVLLDNTASHVFEYSPGTASSKTYTVRVGPSSAGTVYINGTASTRVFGGQSKATIIIEEIA